MKRSRPIATAVLLAATLCGIAPAAVERSIWTDPLGDARVRRTDVGADGALIPGCVLPDVLSVSLVPWAPLEAAANPYYGLPDTSGCPQIFRMDIVLAGLVNPPGPLTQDEFEYAPDRFGPSPLYGFFEIDVDRSRNTGGELSPQARSRLLAVATRFGGRPANPVLFERTAISGADIDNIWDTPPYFERTGADFALALCGCFDAEIVSQSGNCDGRFDAGEEMIVRGRFFQRAGGYRLASQMLGGSLPGMYDPVVDLRFVHEESSDLTIVTLVFPLTQAGAAALAGECEQPIDLSIEPGSHFSIAEAVADLVANAQGHSGLLHELIHRWHKQDPGLVLNPLQWDATFVVGTGYAQLGEAPYAWTDVGCVITSGDLDGDGSVSGADQAAVRSYIQTNDGTPVDADGQVNGTVALADFGPNFSLFDLTNDGSVNSFDVGWFNFPAPCPADWDQNGIVAVPDIFAFLSSWFAGVGDFDHDGANEVPDIFAFLTSWFANSCI